MNTDQQMAAIGKFVTERVALRREAALLIRRIKDTGSALSSLPIGSSEFDHASLDGVLAALPPTLKAINDVIVKGGLEGLIKTIADYQAVISRITELTKSLRDAGAE